MQVWCNSDHSQARGTVAFKWCSAKLCAGGQNNGCILTLSILFLIPSLGSRCTEIVTSYQVNTGLIGPSCGCFKTNTLLSNKCLMAKQGVCLPKLSKLPGFYKKLPCRSSIVPEVNVIVSTQILTSKMFLLVHQCLICQGGGEHVKLCY